MHPGIALRDRMSAGTCWQTGGVLRGVGSSVYVPARVNSEPATKPSLVCSSQCLSSPCATPEQTLM